MGIFDILGKIRDTGFDLMPKPVKIMQLNSALREVRDRKAWAQVEVEHYSNREQEILDKFRELGEYPNE